MRFIVPQIHALAFRSLQWHCRRVVTGAMDAMVQLHELDAPQAAASARRQRQRRTVRWTPEDRPQHIDSRTTTFSCHTRRVKVRPT